MILLTIITFLCIIIGALMIGLSIDTLTNPLMSRGEKKYSLRNLIAGILIIILATSLMSIIMIKSDTEMRQNSNLIISTFDGEIKIYQDYNTGKYFNVCGDAWDLINPQYREYIDTKEAEELIEASKNY